MPPRLELCENEPFSCPAEHLSELASLLGSYLEVHRDGWLIRRVVGHLCLRDGAEVLIRSRKAPALTVLSMMAYVDPTLHSLLHHEIRPDMGGEGELGNLLASLYILELRKALGAHGVQRHYRRELEQSEYIRGRLVFAGQPARQHLGQQTCETWQRNPNTPLNRTLCAAVEKVNRDPVLRRNNEDLVHRLRLLFGSVPPVPERALLLGQQQLGRSDAQFSGALHLARLLLRDRGAEGGGHFAGLSFLLNLELLFERTVQRAFAVSGVRCQAGSPLPYDVFQGGHWSKNTLAMDLFLPDVPLVVDAKFKSRADVGNLHQMLTYCQLTGAKRAVLVFPKGMSGPTMWRFGDVVISGVELCLESTSRAEWDEAGKRMVRTVLGVVGE